MLDIKQWLEGTGLKVAETAFNRSVEHPYIVFIASENHHGSDSVLNLVTRSITIELYAKEIDHESETKIKNLIEAISNEYEKERIKISAENRYETIYDFVLTEKI